MEAAPGTLSTQMPPTAASFSCAPLNPHQRWENSARSGSAQKEQGEKSEFLAVFSSPERSDNFHPNIPLYFCWLHFLSSLLGHDRADWF